MMTTDEARRRAEVQRAFEIGQKTGGCAETNLTIRDHFAALAMQGELACQRDGYEWGALSKLAENAYNVADAMMEARMK